MKKGRKKCCHARSIFVLGIEGLILLTTNWEIRGYYILDLANKLPKSVGQKKLLKSQASSL